MSFLQPSLLLALPLVALPIIIHLINRMRFKRIRWAAMEFLLKAQKRTRRRLIIEQILLLALRCFLVGLLGLLVMRFTGCDDLGQFTTRPPRTQRLPSTTSLPASAESSSGSCSGA